MEWPSAECLNSSRSEDVPVNEILNGELDFLFVNSQSDMS